MTTRLAIFSDLQRGCTTISDMNRERSGSQLLIGELAGDLGLNPKTIRYYEDIGLLPAPQRSTAGYRLYGNVDRERLHFITKAKAIGLTLQEIGEILALKGGGTEPCLHVQDLLARKLAAVDEQLRLLADVRAELLALQDEAHVTACTSTPVCGIIELHEPAHQSTLGRRAEALSHRSTPSHCVLLTSLTPTIVLRLDLPVN